jgi:xylulokinase
MHPRELIGFAPGKRLYGAGMSDSYILAIDLGTSSLKLALVSLRGEVAGFATRTLPISYLPNGGCEQDTETWWTALCSATRELVDSKVVPVDDIIGISCSTTWSDTVAVGTDDKPLMPCIMWMDSRGAPHIKKLFGGFPEVEGYNLTRLLKWVKTTAGVPGLSGKDSIAHILFLKNERPEIYRATKKFLEPMDYLNFRFTGKAAASFASIMLHWATDTRDLAKVEYSQPLLDVLGVEREKLPELRPAGAVLGNLSPAAARELGLSEKVQVVMGTPDIQAAAIGSGAVRDGEAHLCVGTSSWIITHLPYKKSDLFHNMATLPSAIPDRYMLTNEQESAAGALNFLKDSLLFPPDELNTVAPADTHATFSKMAARIPPGSGGLLFTPFLNGERSPVDDRSVRGSFVNLSLTTTRAHLVRAVMEGVAFNSKWLFGYVEKFVGKPIEALTLIGGGVRSDTWCQIFADVLDRPMKQVKDPVMANARGAAFIGAHALGKLRFDEVPALVPIAKTWMPEPKNRRIYDELFAEFHNVYRATSKVCSRLNKIQESA